MHGGGFEHVEQHGTHASYWWTCTKGLKLKHDRGKSVGWDKISLLDCYQHDAPSLLSLLIRIDQPLNGRVLVDTLQAKSNRTDTSV